MEDRYLISPNIANNPRSSLYCVFDGHGGNAAAQFCVNNFESELSKHHTLKTNPTAALTDTYKIIDAKFMESYRVASKTTYFPEMSDPGTTASVVYINDNDIYCSWVGDSRCLLVHKDGTGTFLTIDHKVINSLNKSLQIYRKKRE